MDKLVLASNNKHKIEEIREMFKEKEILSMNDIGYMEDIVEDGETFLDNALIKAKAVSEYLKNKGLNYPVIADDSGLCCVALDGRPGVYSARYSGVHGNDVENRKKLIEELSDKEDKSAYFVCVIVLYYPDGEYKSYEGKTYGKIISDERGRVDFGFDPIFLSDDLGVTFGEATHEDKNKVSHRGRALEKLKIDIK